MWALSCPVWRPSQPIFLRILPKNLFGGFWCRLGLSGKLFFCRFLPNIFLGADESALTCSTRPKRSRLSQCWRFDTCWHVAGHEPIWGAMTNLAFAAKLPADFCRLEGCRGLRSRTKRGLSDLGTLLIGRNRRE